ncbi:MAG TPA: SDR family NAD(P)-dependent oxidoreductase [Candidatus Aquilonibacter sp.]|nr:SDR family NAD(P)-dependent oxidoreductase [Candidatus Aquilonibacter sp.]
MGNELDGAVALITGASSGIGEATARALASRGAKVALAARRIDRLRELENEIKSGGGDAVAIEADVTDASQAESIVRSACGTYGRLDILINNAGVMLLGPIVDAPVDEWHRMIDLNLTALMRVTHAALPHLLDAAKIEGRGVADVVNISSVAGRIARMGSGVYNATKFAVNAFSESLRQEVTTRHVRVGLIEPGFVATELQSHLRPEIREASRSRFAAITQPLEAPDIAEAIAFMVTRPRHMAINEMLMRPTEQEG